ncbi:hypothetical protein PBY51_004209 [Eleginops maclovinus]|uniref:Uncharacterized protein n=1 Tax=Eleginops maclovinus TaxID=56733 RepID=A0AAN7XWK2_ELEMC|nr:hypothetical protein PBY51_004209 [Eleginops maclovinus]
MLQQVESFFSWVRSSACPGSVNIQASKSLDPTACSTGWLGGVCSGLWILCDGPHNKGHERPGRAMCFQSGLDGKSKQGFCVYQATAPSPCSYSRLEAPANWFNTSCFMVWRDQRALRSRKEEESEIAEEEERPDKDEGDGALHDSTFAIARFSTGMDRRGNGHSSIKSDQGNGRDCCRTAGPWELRKEPCRSRDSLHHFVSFTQERSAH